MSDNPWLVSSVQEFSVLKCPECTFSVKEEALFKNHALENHPMSAALFHKQEEYSGFKDRRLYSCDHCSLKFRTKVCLKKHVDLKHYHKGLSKNFSKKLNI